MHGNALFVAQSGLSGVEMAVVSFLGILLFVGLALVALSPVLEAML